MALGLKHQYERRGYLAARLNHHWRALSKPHGNQSDRQRLAAIERYGAEVKTFSDSRLRAEFESLREAIDPVDLVKSLDALVVPVFSLVREASQRACGLFPYPEQILGGLAMVRGGIAEMATGEGKTLAAILPASLFALAGKGVHVITVNSYLAERDQQYTQPIFEMLGLTSGLLPTDQKQSSEKPDAYRKDITYGVGYEFGFDYLRDQLALMQCPHPGPRERLRDALLSKNHSRPNTVQRSLSFAIVDEIDSVLIDEAGSPLLISQGGSNSPEDNLPYFSALHLLPSIEENVHYTIETQKRSIQLSPVGREVIYDAPGIPWESLMRPWEIYVLNALKAEHFFTRDVHYVVAEGKVVIVDEFTGRRHEERTWREGLHQAIEAKENLTPRPENIDSASITRQRFFDQYEISCGMTGTAQESAGEFWHFFKMPVIPIPEHRPCVRKVLPERVFVSREACFAAILQDIRKRKQAGQPVLVGTRTIRVSEEISALLNENSIGHRVLNAKQDEEEGDIISTAGQQGSILIATNMAGRGTHIDLSPETQASGGLHVILVERNESSRIDRQLIGRTARQGQVGTACSYVSADDFLFEQYDPELGDQIRRSRANDQGQVNPAISKSIDQLQHKVERIRYQQRLQMAHRDEWLDQTKKTLA
jgi:preprotein translocase subunit SecA